MATKYTKWMYIVQMAIKYTQHRPLQDPRKFTRIWIFGFRINYLATLIQAAIFGTNATKRFSASARM
jgi:hypothetical protein